MKYSVLPICLIICCLCSVSSLAQISRIEPDQPQWGQTLTIIYNTAAPGARFTPEDEVYIAARLTFPGLGQNLSAKMARDGTSFSYRLNVPNGLSNISVHFITLSGGWDEGAYTTSMIHRSDGIPARGAFESRINSQRYQEFFRREIDLYPDNYSAYRTKWSMAAALEGEKASSIVGQELRKLSRLRNETPELLYALSYGNLLLLRESKGREMIIRLIENFPDSTFTGLAIRDYESETANLGIGGDHSGEIGKIKLAVIQRRPDSEFARNASSVMSKEQRAPLDLIETITQLWMKAEPENPLPYFNLAQAYKNQYQKYDLAVPMIEKATSLLLEGKMRLYGDINGRQTTTMLAEAYLAGADLAFRLNQNDKALSAIKAVRSFELETSYASYLLEAKICLAQGQEAQAETAFITAWRRGSLEAEERLKTRYKSKHGSLQGFDEYLLEADKKSGADGAVAGAKSPSPHFKVNTLEGRTLDLNALNGKVVVLNLWFIGCGPCRKEIPKLNQLVTEFKGKNVVFIAPALDQADLLRNFLKIMPFNYEIIPDAEEIIVGKFNATNFPTHIVINQDGQIDTTLVGGNERRPEEVRRALLRLLNILGPQQ